MATKKRTTRSTRRSKTQNKKRFSFGNAFLGALIIAAGFGWAVSYTSTQPSKSPSITVKTQSSAPRQQATLPAHRTDTIDSLLPREIGRPQSNVPTPAAAPHKQPLPAQQAPMQAMRSPNIVVPYKPDTNLPPQGRFAVNNAANAIFARQTLTIYSNANETSKKIATVHLGQEMRSYEKSGQWHRVVVPSTDIIGWAKADQLTRIQPQYRADQTVTGAISRRP